MVVYCKDAQMETLEMVGLKPIFSTIPLKTYFTGVLPKTLKFEIIKNLSLSYMGIAQKKV
jgi:2-polyprenyl-6-hydroxyphenyl methylase/3-demethylubiquinone-9 3-methyltransferase